MKIATTIRIGFAIAASIVWSILGKVAGQNITTDPDLTALHSLFVLGLSSILFILLRKEGYQFFDWLESKIKRIWT